MFNKEVVAKFPKNYLVHREKHTMNLKLQDFWDFSSEKFSEFFRRKIPKILQFFNRVSAYFEKDDGKKRFEILAVYHIRLRFRISFSRRLFAKSALFHHKLFIRNKRTSFAIFSHTDNVISAAAIFFSPGQKL